MLVLLALGPHKSWWPMYAVRQWSMLMPAHFHNAAFLDQMQKGGDMNLIGQFGVGFYSVYLVADWVEVVSKHNDDAQHVWSSGVDGGFSIAEDKQGEPLGRGTLIRLHLKPEAQEYAQVSFTVNH
jgi:HSP90 family molecular chaperone